MSVINQIKICHIRRLLWLLVVMASPGLSINAQAAVNIRYYDADRDGLISPAEYREFLLRQLRIPMSVLDRDGNDEISPEEIDALSKLLQSTNDRVSSYEIDSPGGLDLYAFAEQEGLTEETRDPPASWLERRGILVRGNLESLSLFADAKPLSAASAASLSFSKDFNDRQAWSTIKGVLMRPVKFDAEPNVIFVPSVALNRTHYTESVAKGTNTLIFRTAVEHLYPLPGVEVVESLNFRFNPAYITDSEFATAIVAVEFQLQLTATQLGIGKTIPARAFQFNWLPNIFSEYGRVLRHKDESEEKSRFFRIGPRVEIEFWLRDLKQLRAALSAQHLLSFRSESRSRKSVEASLSLALDATGHLALQVKYVNGDSSAKLEDEHFWTLGLGVKY